MKNLFRKKHSIREEASNTKNFRLISYAFIIGIIVGVIGAIFRITLAFIIKAKSYLYTIDTNTYIKVLIPVLFSITCIYIAFILVKKYAPETAGSGIQEIEGTLDGLRPMRWKRVIPIKFFGSILSLSSGLLLGREGPTIQLGANIGKMIKDLFKESDIEDNPLVSAGSAAGLSAAFNAPFSGVIFVIEEMHGHFKFNLYSVAAIMVGAASADIMVRYLIGSEAALLLPVYHTPDLKHLWLFILLGLIFSLVGLIYNKLLIYFLNFFDALKKKTSLLIIAIILGAIISTIGYFFPNMTGGGYEVILDFFKHSNSITILIILLLSRLILSTFSYGSGQPGGIFAPMLVLGVILGFVFELTLKAIYPSIDIPVGVFAIAGMAAIFASTVMAPITGLVLAIEMTSNYEMILPLIITTVTTTVLTAIWSNKPIYSTLLQRTLNNTTKFS